ncbi:hypothetical protein ACJ72_06907 [Emergomyces africanus]|uniref:Uncharacterized protein n=1 Tax=Emergomyces africanus TaxID=1955775 RepID=A0A1B7NPP5_9EURO|nr:hypothetical protein ACJ72_06907 [Emergomyces africanus]
MIVDVTERSKKHVLIPPGVQQQKLTYGTVGDTLSNRRSILEAELKKQPPKSVRILFAGKQADCKRFLEEYPEVIANFSIPYRFWATSTKDLNGCSDAKYTYDDDGGALTSLDTWSCFKIKEADSSGVYVWYQMTMFIRWSPIEKNTFIFWFAVGIAPEPWHDGSFSTCLTSFLSIKLPNTAESDRRNVLQLLDLQ